jgi:hypothetical protein
MRQCKEGKIKIDEDMAIKIISDHKDVYLDKESNPCSRTICAHYDEDKREYMSDPSRPKPNQPRGAVDAKVGSSKLFKNNRFLAIWGRACGAPFNAKEFCGKHIQWADQEKYLEDRPTMSWVECNCILADKDTDAPNALKVYCPSVYKSKNSDIFSSSSLPPSSPPSSPSASPILSPIPSAASALAPAPAPAPAPSAPSAANATAPPIIGTETLLRAQQQQQQQQQQQKPKLTLDDDEYDLDGGKYNKKDMKMFMKMLKNKNKKSTKQVIKNRNTKKNKN